MNPNTTPHSEPASGNARPLRLRWLLTMAWRDSRTHRKRLFLYISSIILGTAALVAIRTLGDNMQQAVDEEAKALLGADFSLISRQPFPPPVEALIDSIGGEQARQTRFSSMIFFPKNQKSRLVQIRAVEGNFPFYGVLETVPAGAAQSFRSAQQALVDEGLMIQFGMAAGDSVKIGDLRFEIAGSLRNIPGETAAMSTIGPRVYIPAAYLEATRLIQAGSRITYSVLFKFDGGVDVEALATALRPYREKYFLSIETVESRKRSLARQLTNLYRFLNLGGFIALILGSVGVASAVHTYIKQKIATVAVLRCLGADTRQTFVIYLVQAVAMGVAGAGAGVLLGIGLLAVLPSVIQDFLPVDLSTVSVSWLPVAQGMGIGLSMAVLFALLPLLSIRNVSPLLALRSSFEENGQRRDDPLRWVVFSLLGMGIVLFGISQTRQWFQGVGFAAGLGVSFGLLTLVAYGLMRVVKTHFPASWSYIWRQGLANLYRPQNQTVVLVLALGLGTFLITTLYLMQNSLLGHLSLTGGENKSNMVLFDIQPDQKEPLIELLGAYNLPVMQQVPVVTMRIAAVKGRTVEDIRADTTRSVPGWPLRREYRSTYRDHLIDTETLVAGRFHGTAAPSDTVVYVSLETGIAEDLRVTIGDPVTWDVQGVLIPTIVGSLREVNWQRVQPNFFVVFPAGVLEYAPQFHVLVTRTPSPEVSARFQRDVVLRYPNVSMIDLALILNTVNEIMDKVSLVIRFMALFSVVTGLIVLTGVITNSRFQRIQESVLLKTLGGSRRQILRIMVLEYLFLGVIAAMTGVLLSYAGTWALSRFVFEISFVPAVMPTLLVALAIVALTVGVGMFVSRGIHDRPPLEILRSEV